MATALYGDRTGGEPDEVAADVASTGDAVPSLPASAPMAEIMAIMKTHGR